MYQRLFGLLLTDRDPEFAKPQLFEHSGIHNLCSVSRASVCQCIYHIKYLQTVKHVQDNRNSQSLLQHRKRNVSKFLKSISAVNTCGLIINIGNRKNTNNEDRHDISGSTPDINTHNRPECNLWICKPFLCKAFQADHTQSLIKKTILRIQNGGKYKTNDQNGKNRRHIHNASVEVLRLNISAEGKGKQKSQSCLGSSCHHCK